MDKKTKWILIFMGVVLAITMILSHAWGDDRTDLTEEAQRLQQEIQQFQQAVNQRQIRLVEIQGVFKYWDLQEQREKEVNNETPKKLED